jgi:hypothetical protein
LQDRERLYDLFENYEALKQDRGEWDSGDRVNWLWKVVVAVSRGGSSALQSVVDEMYVDEVQDLSPSR